MKQLCACLLALTLALAGLTASALEAADVVGTWYLNDVKQGASSVNPATLGLEITLTLSGDGTATLVSMGKQQASAWRLAGDTVVVDEGVDAMVFTLADGNLETDLDGMIMVFGRAVVSEGSFVAPAVVPATEVSDFDGEWLGTMVVTGGISMTPEMPGLALFASISSGTIRLRVVSGDIDRTSESQGTLEDGALTSIRDNEGEEEQLLLQLRDDGSLSIRFSTDDAFYDAYYEKAAAPGAGAAP